MSIPSAYTGDPTDPDGALILQHITGLYDAYLEKDRARADSFISDEATMWDSEYVPLLRGLDALNALRNARPPAEDASLVTGIDVTEPVVDVWGDVAVAKHVFTVHFADGRPDEVVRNTGVWRRTSDGWKIFHNHEDVVHSS